MPSEEGDDALLDQRRGVLVVVGQAAVGEQVPVARVQKQLAMTPELRLSAADYTLALCDGECPLASDFLLYGLARAGEILAVEALA
jgi:hypothetical protein